MIHLTFSPEPIDCIRRTVALAAFFEDERPLKGRAGLIDWRVNGKLSKFILKKKINGASSEVLMMPVAGRMQARDLLLFGLGKRAELNDERSAEHFSVVVEKMSKIKCRDFVMSFLDLADDFLTWRSLVKVFIEVLLKSADGGDWHITCSEAAKWIQEAKRRKMDFGPEVLIDYAL